MDISQASAPAHLAELTVYPFGHNRHFRLELHSHSSALLPFKHLEPCSFVEEVVYQHHRLYVFLGRFPPLPNKGIVELLRTRVLPFVRAFRRIGRSTFGLVVRRSARSRRGRGAWDRRDRAFRRERGLL